MHGRHCLGAIKMISGGLVVFRVLLIEGRSRQCSSGPAAEVETNEDVKVGTTLTCESIRTAWSEVPRGGSPSGRPLSLKTPGQSMNKLTSQWHLVPLMPEES